MTTTEIREALHGVGEAIVPPPVDEVAFRAAVRAERRRHRGGRVVLAGLVAAVVAGVVVTVVPFVGGDGGAPTGPATGTGAVEVVAPPEVVWFLEDHRLRALDPSGELHDAGPAEEVLGSTAEGVWAVDDESRVVWFAARHGDEGPGEGAWSFERRPGPPGVDEPPVAGPVQSAVLSRDGRYLAWLDLDGQVTTYDLVADAVRSRSATPRNTALVDVGDAGVLLSEDGALWLRGERDVAVPTRGDGYGVASSLARTSVAVADRDGATRLYDVSTGRAERTATVPGLGELAADGATLAVLARNEADTETTLTVRQDGRFRPVTGLVGTVQSIQWADLGADRQALLVVTHRTEGSLLHLCDGEALACEPVHAGEDVRLPVAGY